ncbi:MAG: EAL domain-containing protein [Pseudomonadota bacterium]
MPPELARALTNDEFRLDYQPKVDLISGKVVGVEALIRWHHPTRGRLGPDLFIPLAEASGQIGDVTRWVMRTAVGQWRRWRDRGLEISIAVNFFPAAISTKSIFRTCSKICAAPTAWRARSSSSRSPRRRRPPTRSR